MKCFKQWWVVLCVVLAACIRDTGLQYKWFQSEGLFKWWSLKGVLQCVVSSERSVGFIGYGIRRTVL